MSLIDAPCPFCGSTLCAVHNGGGFAFVVCSECDADGPLAKNATEAMAKWRKRVPQRRERRLELEAQRFGICRHAARSMPEDGGEKAFVAAIDAYKVENGI